MKILYTDGGCTNNNHTDVAKRAMSVAVVDDRGEVLVLKEECGGSNNIAEFLAVKEALIWAKQQGYKALQIRTDSKNNLSWLEGRIGTKINDRERVGRIYSEVAASGEKLRRN